MTTSVIGLLWLVSTGVLCLVIGRAIRAADRQDDEGARAAQRSRSRAGGASTRTLPARPPSPDVDELEQWFRTSPWPPAGPRHEPPAGDPEDAG
ncbi:hypothetical protein [Modestobacter excelsi]|uniref:hypothetical protein n=1 Tax=Modestobacter excelsi TaxID=2213161 RepID=UPI00110CBA55|nr:hypothetical protein [Modestobacter excelsi]